MLNQQTPDLRKFFTGKEFPGVEIIQSPFLAVQGKYYAVVGQRAIRSSPFITNYIVFDEMGNAVSNPTAEKVYEYVAMTHMAQFMSEKKSQIRTPAKRRYNDRELDEVDHFICEKLRLNYKSDHGINISDLGDVKNRNHSLFEKVESTNEKLLKMDYLAEDIFKEFQQAWEAFWKIYQERMSRLFHFYSYCESYHLTSDVLAGTQLNDIYQEAREMYNLFTKSIPEDAPIIEEVHNFITLMAQLGHVSSTTKRGKFYKHIIASWSFFLENFVQFLLWIFLPMSVLFFFVDIISFSMMVGSFFIMVGGYAAYVFIRYYLKKSAENRILKERGNYLGEQPIIQHLYNDVYTELLELKKAEKEKQKKYEFPATYTRIHYYFLIIGMCIILYPFIDLESPEEHFKIYMNMGGITLFIGILLMIYFRGTINLSSKGLTFKIARFPIDTISNITCNASGSKVFINVMAYSKRRIVLKVPKGHRQEARAILKEWISENNISIDDTPKRNLHIFGKALFYIALLLILVLVIGFI